MFKLSIALFGLLAVAREIKCDGAQHSDASAFSNSANKVPGPEGISVNSAGYDFPPPPGGPAVPPGGLPGIIGGWPGFGFSKNLNLNAGAGFLPFLSGLGLSSPPPVPIDGAVPPGLFGGPGGFLGPSYIPSSWLGSALGAKGDLLFPIVIVIFFLVGVWTVIQFLLALIVPLIASKIGVVHGIANAKRIRSIPQQESTYSEEELAQRVHDALEKYGALTNNNNNNSQAEAIIKNFESKINSTNVHANLEPKINNTNVPETPNNNSSPIKSS